MLNYIIIFSIIVIIIFYTLYNYKNKENFDNKFLDEQIKYYESRKKDINIPSINEADIFYKFDKDSNNLVISGPVGKVQDSEVDIEVAKCKALTNCDDLNNTKCGMCLYNNKVMYGDKNGPLADVCPGGWVKDASICKKKKEQEICSKVKSCGTMVGEASICGWCASSNKAFVAKEVNGKLVPKYSDDKCMTEGIFGTSTNMNLFPSTKCAQLDKDFPCYGPTMNSGPHSSQCLNKLWEQVGCSVKGTTSPYNNKSINWWNKQSILKVANDMKNYKKYADSNDWKIASAYHPRCYGTDVDPCSDKFAIKPLQCYQQKFVEAGCRKEGSAYPTKDLGNTNINDYITTIKNLASTAHSNFIDFNIKNDAFNKCYGGNLISPPKPKKQDVDIQPGLNAFIYENTSSSGVIGRPINTNPTRINNVNFWWGSGNILSNIKDKVYVVIEGYIVYPKNTTNVKYRIGSDDGSKLIINGSVEIDNWGLHGFRWREGNIRNITKQVEDLRIEMFEWTGAANLKLEWSLDGKPFTKIPDSQFKSSIMKNQDIQYNINDYVMYGQWFGKRSVPVKKIIKDGEPFAFITEDGPFTKIVKKWPNTVQSLYYRGNISQYGTIPMTKAPKNVYIVKNIKTGINLT
jgi:hypothetical protein